MLFKKINYNNIPKHIAIIMDGNGRWAQRRNLPRVMGHKNAIPTIKKLILHSDKIGIKILTLFAFSTENWNRPKEEVKEILSLIKKFLNDNYNEILENNIKVQVFGELDKFDDDIKESVLDIIKATKNCSGLIVNICMNYGSKQEILLAINNIIKDKLTFIDEEILRSYLYTKDLYDPDFIIRTSGEQRISNFLLFQSAYSEFYFPKTYFPDFNEKHLNKAIKVYQSRKRRFGGLTNLKNKG